MTWHCVFPPVNILCNQHELHLINLNLFGLARQRKINEINKQANDKQMIELASVALKKTSLFIQRQSSALEMRS